jgi:flagellar protein FlaG
MKRMGMESISTRNTQKSAETKPAVFPAKEDAISLSSKDSYPTISPDFKGSNEALQKAAEKVNKLLSGTPMKFEFSFHESSSFVAIKVIDSVTNKVIREIPSEQFFELMDKLPEISGAIFDEKG